MNQARTAKKSPANRELQPPVIDYSGSLLAGVDEAGRGPLVGNVVAAAVILDLSHPIDGLADSKKLSEKRREQLFAVILEHALSVGVGRATPVEIDELNILHASMLAMQRAVDDLAVKPEYAVVDGNRLPDWQLASQAVVKGDQRVQCISAASIVAKVTRDQEMKQLDNEYPAFQFATHKGYPTKAHLEILQRLGPTSQHRKSFAPVRKLL